MEIFKKPPSGEPIPWQPCCDKGRGSIYVIYPAAKLVVWWKRRKRERSRAGKPQKGGPVKAAMMNLIRATLEALTLISVTDIVLETLTTVTHYVR